MPVRHPRAARVLDVALMAAAVTVVVIGLARWAVDGAPTIHPDSIIALGLSGVAVLLLLLQDEQWPVVSTPPVILGATLSVIGSRLIPQTGEEILPVWCAVVMACFVTVRRGRYLALARAAVVIVAGQALVAAQTAVQRADGPAYTGVAAGLAAYTVLTLALLDLRRRLRGARRRRLAMKTLTYPLIGAAYGVCLLVVLALIRQRDRDAIVIGVVVVLVALLGTIVWSLVRIRTLRRLTATLIEAARETPWPAASMDDILVRLVGHSVDAESVALERAPAPAPAISEPIDAGQYLVVRRRPGDYHFSRNDHRLVEAVAALGRTAHIRARTEEALFTDAVTDDLTGLWEYKHWRTSILDDMSAHRRPGEVLGVVFFDFDHFKRLNETYGHLRADEVLATVGRRLRSLSRNWRFARFGGDEMVGLVRDVRDEAHLDELCEELERTVAEPVHADGRAIVATVTVGRTLSRFAEDRAEVLVARADADLRHRKHSRPGPEAGPTDQEMVQSLLEGGLAVALQPVFRFADRALNGFEALLRGRVGDHGAVPPDELVEAARRLGALDQLTRRVAEIAVPVVEEASRRYGRALGVSVNLETEQLRYDSDLLAWIIARAQGSPARLIVEITERGDAAWTEEQYDAVDRLRNAGVESSLDDYGSGQSRLRPVTSRTWHWVKMDRDFLTTDEGGLVMLRHTVQALHELGLQVVLEGLETDEQVELARSLGIEYGQGFVLSPPIPSDRLLDEVARWASR